MSQPLSYAAGFSGQVPANLQCGFCKEPIQNQFYRTMNRFACSKCAAEAQAVIDRNSLAAGPIAVAAIAGLAVALAGGAIWAVIVHVSHVELGLVASFIGVAVAKAIVAVSGKRRGTVYQILASVLAIIGIVAGKFLLISWQLVDQLNREGDPVNVHSVLAFWQQVLAQNAKDIFSVFDLIWIAIAVYAAWRICQAPAISVAGPFAFRPSASAGLQFSTVEPTSAPNHPGAQ